MLSGKYKDEKGWWFWDEASEYRLGPFKSLRACNTVMRMYGQFLTDGSPPSPKLKKQLDQGTLQWVLGSS